MTTREAHHERPRKAHFSHLIRQLWRDEVLMSGALSRSPDRPPVFRAVGALITSIVDVFHCLTLEVLEGAGLNTKTNE